MATSFGITGTPGTGKKTVAPIVAACLRVPCYNLNDLAVKFGLTTEGAEVDSDKLGRKLREEFKEPCIFVGHLLPYSLQKEQVSRVVVLRCNPKSLRKRLEARGYVDEKVKQNVEAELIGLISADSLSRFGKTRVWEVDTTNHSPSDVAAHVVDIFKGRREPKSLVDWAGDYSSAADLGALFSSLRLPLYRPREGQALRKVAHLTL